MSFSNVISEFIKLICTVVTLFVELIRDVTKEHFEVFFLFVLFVTGAVILAHWPNNEKLSQWVIGGTVIGIIGRALQNNQPPPPSAPTP